MSATNCFINWHGAGFTPTGGSLTPITRVTECKVSRDGDAVEFKGDAAVYNQVVAVPSQMRSIELTSADVKTLAGIAIGSKGAFTVTLDDAINGATAAGGAVTIALTLCVVTKNSAQGAHAKYAEATITFEGYVSDGTTDPMVITAL